MGLSIMGILGLSAALEVSISLMEAANITIRLQDAWSDSNEKNSLTL